MVVFETLANIAVVFEDILVLCSLLGSVALLTFKTVNCFKTWRDVAPVQLEILPLVGWIPAAACLAGVIVAGRTEPLGGNVLQLTVLGTIGLLALAVLILLAGEWMDRLAVRRRTPRRPSDPKAS